MSWDGSLGPRSGRQAEHQRGRSRRSEAISPYQLFTRQPDQRPPKTFLRDVIQDPFCLTPAETTEGVMRRAEPMAWVKELPEKERTVILARFGLDGAESRTLEEIGREMGLTRERVRQMETAALVRLRGIIERKTMKRADLL